MFNLHAVINLPKQNWGGPVRKATDSLTADWPQAQTRVYGHGHPQLVVDRSGEGEPHTAIAALQQLGLQLNPQGLTLIEASDGKVDGQAAVWTGYHAAGPSWVVSQWLAEGARLDRDLGYSSPIAVQLRYLDAAEVAA